MAKGHTDVTLQATLRRRNEDLVSPYDPKTGGGGFSGPTIFGQTHDVLDRLHDIARLAQHLLRNTKSIPGSSLLMATDKDALHALTLALDALGYDPLEAQALDAAMQSRIATQKAARDAHPSIATEPETPAGG